MYRVFILSTVHGYAHAEVRRNGEFLTYARGATTAQAIRAVKRAVRIARHAGEFHEVPAFRPDNPWAATMSVRADDETAHYRCEG